MNAGHPAPTAAGKSALAILATRLPKTTPIEQEQAMAAIYASRGDAMLAIKDISAARKFYEYAANCGSARAATALAGTYDPAFLVQLNAVGVRPDPALAADWYRRATTLGAPDAEARLHAAPARKSPNRFSTSSTSWTASGIANMRLLSVPGRNRSGSSWTVRCGQR